MQNQKGFSTLVGIIIVVVILAVAVGAWYYLSNNLTEWGKELERIRGKYMLTQVSEGCLGTCNIYRLKKNK